MTCWIFDPTVIKLASLPFVNVGRCNQETDGKAQAWTACPYYLLKTLVKKSGQQKGKPWENNTNCSTALLPKMTWTHSNIIKHLFKVFKGQDHHDWFTGLHSLHQPIKKETGVPCCEAGESHSFAASGIMRSSCFSGIPSFIELLPLAPYLRCKQQKSV